MTFRRLPTSLRASSFALSIVAASALFGCSGNSDTDSDNEDETGGTSGTGGSAGSGTSGSGGMSGSGVVAPECELDVGPIDPTALIDDLEDGNPVIPMVGGRSGSWWISTDMTDGATVTPPGEAAPNPERILGKRCESEFGMRMTGQGFTNWGAVLSAGFKYEDGLKTIDASAFRGVMFWARVGETHNSPVRVQFQDSNTQPEGGMCNPEPGSADECYNGWGVEVIPISTQWRLYKLDFSRMTQRDFGYRADAIDTTALYGMEWNVQPNTVFDLWIDDVWFYE